MPLSCFLLNECVLCKYAFSHFLFYCSESWNTYLLQLKCNGGQIFAFHFHLLVCHRNEGDIGYLFSSRIVNTNNCRVQNAYRTFIVDSQLLFTCPFNQNLRNKIIIATSSLSVRKLHLREFSAVLNWCSTKSVTNFLLTGSLLYIEVFRAV